MTQNPSELFRENPKSCVSAVGKGALWMDNDILVKIVASKHALDRPRTAGTARLWVGESEEGQIQIAFLGPGPGGAPLLTATADKAAEQFHEAYMMQALMNGDDSAETQIRVTRRFWAELLACPESWQGLGAQPARGR